MPESVKWDAHENLRFRTVRHQTPMRNKIRPEHPFRPPSGLTLPGPPLPLKTHDFRRRLAFVPVAFYLEMNAMKGGLRWKAPLLGHFSL